MPFNAVTKPASAATSLASVADWSALPGSPSDGDQRWVRDASIGVQYVQALTEWIPFGLLNDAMTGIHADVKGWWTADSLDLADGDDVDSWPGLIGGTFAQNSTDNVPTMDVNTTAGTPNKFVDFGATSTSWLVGDSTADGLIDGPLDYCQVFALIKVVNTDNNQTVIVWHDGNTSQISCRAVASPSSNVGIWFHENSAGATDYEELESSTPKIATGNWGVNGWMLNTTTCALWRGTPSSTTGQKLAYATRSAEALFASSNMAAMMGRNSTASSNYSDLEVADVLVIVRDFDLRCELAVEIDAWLKARAGV